MKTYRNYLGIGLFGVLVFAFICPRETDAQDVCRQAAFQADMQIRNAYGQQIDYYLRLAAGAQAKGFNPQNFPQAGPDGVVVAVNLHGIVQNLAYQRQTALQAIFQSFSECVRGFAPYQQILNVGMFFMTGGLSSVIPPAATYIDASQLLSGTPFGGSSALVPKARDQILDGLGIGGDAAKILRNPRCIFGC